MSDGIFGENRRTRRHRHAAIVSFPGNPRLRSADLPEGLIVSICALGPASGSRSCYEPESRVVLVHGVIALGQKPSPALRLVAIWGHSLRGVDYLQ